MAKATMEGYLKEAQELAKDAMEMSGCSYKECFPYIAYRMMTDDQGRNYKVKIEIDLN